MSDQKVIEREFGNLLAIKDNYRKIVVSMDEFAQGNVNGVVTIQSDKLATPITRDA